MKAENMSDEGVMRLAEACMRQLAESYCGKSDNDLESYEKWLRGFLTNKSWMRSMVDPDVVIDGLRRLRNKRTSKKR